MGNREPYGRLRRQRRTRTPFGRLRYATAAPRYRMQRHKRRWCTFASDKLSLGRGWGRVFRLRRFLYIHLNSFVGMEDITQVAKTALQTGATKSTPRSSLFMFDIGRPDTCAAIDLIINAQPSVTPYHLASGDHSSTWLAGRFYACF